MKQPTIESVLRRIERECRKNRSIKESTKGPPYSPFNFGGILAYSTILSLCRKIRKEMKGAKE